jgi:hypothetical protein
MGDLVTGEGPVGMGRVSLAYEVVEAIPPKLHLSLRNAAGVGGDG